MTLSVFEGCLSNYRKSQRELSSSSSYWVRTPGFLLSETPEQVYNLLLLFFPEHRRFVGDRRCKMFEIKMFEIIVNDNVLDAEVRIIESSPNPLPMGFRSWGWGFSSYQDAHSSPSYVEAVKYVEWRRLP